MPTLIQLFVLAAFATSVLSKTTPDATCGGKNGYTCLSSRWGNCCSRYGYCGSTDAYCGTGCQSLFGTCKGSPAPSSTKPATPTPSVALQVTKDAKCGKVDGKTCLTSQWGNCCSQHGYCGSTKDYCGTGCQAGFGKCGVASSSAVRSSSTRYSTVIRSSTIVSVVRSSSSSTQSGLPLSSTTTLSSTTSSSTSSSETLSCGAGSVPAIQFRPKDLGPGVTYCSATPTASSTSTEAISTSTLVSSSSSLASSASIEISTTSLIEPSPSSSVSSSSSPDPLPTCSDVSSPAPTTNFVGNPGFENFDTWNSSPGWTPAGIAQYTSDPIYAQSGGCSAFIQAESEGGLKSSLSTAISGLDTTLTYGFSFYYRPYTVDSYYTPARTIYVTAYLDNEALVKIPLSFESQAVYYTQVKVERIRPQSSSPLLKFELSLPELDGLMEAEVKIFLDSVSLTQEAISTQVCGPPPPGPTVP